MSAARDPGSREDPTGDDGLQTDFLFVYPERAYGGFCSGFSHHLGVSYVLAYGNYRADRARPYLAGNGDSWQNAAARIAGLARMGVGFSVYEHNYPFVSSLAARIRRLRPDLLIVCGGASATFSAPRIFADNDAVDLCVAGEAERTFKALADANFSRLAWPGIPGLAYRAGDGCRETAPREFFSSPDGKKDSLAGLPSPYLNGFLPAAAAPFAQVSSSRGCPYACTYCSFTSLGGRFIRFVPEAQVLDELKLICAHFRGTGESVTIPFSDDNFTVRLDRAKRILDGMAAFRPRNVHFSVQARPDSGLDGEFYSMARAAGIAEINFGLESADPHVLSLVNKLGPRRNDGLGRERRYIEQTREQVGAAVGHGIAASVSVILGLPGDTAERGARTLKFVKDLPIQLYAHNYLNIYDGTELARTHRHYGMDRVIGEHAPFPTTVHAYDVKRLPFSSHCDRARAYASQTLARAVGALSGMTAGGLPATGAPVFLELEDDERHEPVAGGSLPLGTHFLVLASRGRHLRWRALAFGSEHFEPVPGGFLLSAEVLEGSDLLPLITFPGQKAAAAGGRSLIEFAACAPDDPFPESERNHWRLPYAACGLLPARCPAQGAGLRSRLSRGGCVFFAVGAGPGAPPACAACEVSGRCPRCAHLLSLIGERYCDFQRSGRPFSVLAYLSAHLNVLRSPEFRLDEFPAIRLEDFPASTVDARVLTIGGTLHVMQTSEKQVGQRPSGEEP
jgi:hypothetical protein